MALLVVTELGQTAIEEDATLTAADALLSDNYPNDERTFFVMDNADASQHVGTISALRATADKHGFGSLAVSDITITVPAGERRMVRAPMASHSDASGRVTVTYDDVTSVTVGAFRLDRH
jgi:hypothetical protein